MQNNTLQRHMDRAALAAKYRLGIPLKRHTHNLGNAVGIGCAVLVLVFFLLLILGVVVEDIMPQQRVLGWILLLLGVLALVRLALVFSTTSRLADRSVAYECSEGVVIVSASERGQAEHVLMALRWVRSHRHGKRGRNWDQGGLTETLTSSIMSVISGAASIAFSIELSGDAARKSWRTVAPPRIVRLSDHRKKRKRNKGVW